MDIRIGDIVKFITDKLEGKVTSLLDATTVNVYVEEYGFEIPASVKNLVVIKSQFQQEVTNANNTTNIKPIEIEDTNTLFLGIVPLTYSNLAQTNFEIYLVNDTNKDCLFTISTNNGSYIQGLLAGSCNKQSISTISTYSIKEIDTNIKTIHVQAIFFQKGKTTVDQVIDSEIKINTTSLLKGGAYKNTRWFTSPCLLKPLNTDKIDALTSNYNKENLQQLEKEKIKNDSIPDIATKPEKLNTSDCIEIDLHCNQLLDSTQGMEAGDILEYQMDVFRSTMEKYKLRRGTKIVFIHGKGEGVLRQRILWELQRKYKQHRHQDASFKQYGYGATLVTIK